MVRITGSDEFRDRAQGALNGLLESPVHLVELTAPSLQEVRDLVAARREEEFTVVVLTEPPAPHVVRVLIASVEGVLTDGDLAARLPAAISAVGLGLRTVANEHHSTLRAPDLSSREKQVLAMVVLDMSNAEIAAKLHVSESNVKFHLSAAFRKLGVGSRAAAAAMVLDPDAGLGPGILRITPGSGERL